MQGVAATVGSLSTEPFNPEPGHHAELNLNNITPNPNPKLQNPWHPQIRKSEKNLLERLFTVLHHLTETQMEALLREEETVRARVWLCTLFCVPVWAL